MSEITLTEALQAVEILRLRCEALEALLAKATSFGYCRHVPTPSARTEISGEKTVDD